MPSPNESLLEMLRQADALVADEMCDGNLRRVWERRWQETAQFWDSGGLGQTGESPAVLIRLLRECEGGRSEVGGFGEEG
jgi:hypothetical protein